MMQYIKRFLEEIKKYGINVQDILKNNKIQQFTSILLIEPNKFRLLDEIVKGQLKDAQLDVINAYVMNKEKKNIEQAGEVNLEVRKDYKEGDEIMKSDDEEEQTKDIQIKDKHNIDDQKSKLTSKQKKMIFRKEQEELKKKQELEQIENENIIKNKYKEVSNQQVQSSTNQLKCISCVNAIFNSQQEFRAHYKSEWHVCNVKRKADNQPTFDLEEFKEYLFDLQYIQQKNK